MALHDIQDQTTTLLDDLGFTDAPEDQKQEVIAKIQEMVDTEILYTLISRLSEEQVMHLESELEKLPEDEETRAVEMIRIIKELLPDYEEIIGRALEELYLRLRQDAQSVRDYLESQGTKIDSAEAPQQEQTPDIIAGATHNQLPPEDGSLPPASPIV